MILWIIILFLTILAGALGYTTYNLLRKNETAEDLIIGYLNYIEKFCERVVDDVVDINVESNQILNKFLKRFKDECI